MANPAREIEKRALELRTKERARLAQRLLSSFDEDVGAMTEADLIAEMERRLDEIESGAAAAVPAEFVFQRLRSKLR